MSFSLPSEVLDTLKIVVCVRVNENGDLRSSFELKALPSHSAGPPLQSTMRFEVIEGHREVTLVISKESNASPLPSASTQRHTLIPSYIGEENILPQGLGDQGNISSVQPPGDPWDESFLSLPFCSSGSVACMTSATTDMPMSEFCPQEFQGNSRLASARSSMISSVSDLVDIGRAALPANLSGSSLSSPAYDSGCSSLTPTSSGRQASSTQESLKTSPPATSGRQSRARNFPCTQPTCTRTFTSTYTRDAHMLTHRPKPPKVFHCTIGCGAFFSRQHDRWRHEVTQHGKPSNWQCARCSQFFSSQRRLDVHADSCRGVTSGPADDEGV